MDIGDRIRAARRERGITQEQLAEAVGVNKSAVAQWESPGTSRTGIKTENLIAAARFLEVRPSQLMDDLSSADEMRLVDPKEIALIDLFRRMEAATQDVHLQLFYTSVGLAHPKKANSDPSKGRRAVSARAAKKTA